MMPRRKPSKIVVVLLALITLLNFIEGVKLQSTNLSTIKENKYLDMSKKIANKKKQKPSNSNLIATKMVGGSAASKGERGNKPNSLNQNWYNPSTARQSTDDPNARARADSTISILTASQLQLQGGGKVRRRKLSPRDNRMTLFSSIAVYRDLEVRDSVPLPQSVTSLRHIIQERLHRLSNIDVQDTAIVVAYACTQFALTLPVILIPMIVADPFAPGYINTSQNINAAQFVGTIVSLSTFGAGVGKLVNGFVCQAIGGRASGCIYLLGLAVSAVVLSLTSTVHGYAIAGMEFFASALWTAMSVLIANRYETNPQKFTAGIMSLSLASTTGTLLAKTIGGVLLSRYDWRSVCRLSTVFASIGSAVLYFCVKEENAGGMRQGRNRMLPPFEKRSMTKSQGLSFRSITKSMSNVLGRPMFWAVAFAHFCVFIVRSSDKVLGTFISDATNLPRYLCGTLTASVTAGFISGLVSGRKMQDMETIKEKKAFTFQRYIGAALSAVGLALCGNGQVVGLLGKYGAAGAITILSGLMARCAGFQLYQFPPKYASSFGEDKAVFISLCDGVALFLLSPFWSNITRFAGNNKTSGWTISWLAVAAFLGLGGTIMTNNLQTVLRLEGKDRE